MAPKTTQKKSGSENEQPKKQVNTKKKSAKNDISDPEPEIPVQTVPVAQVIETVVEKQVITEDGVNESDIIPVEDRFTDVANKLQTMASTIKILVSEVKTLQKEYVKSQKNTKKKPKNNDTGVKRPPSGFAKPTQIDDTLASFLGVPKGSLKSRTDVTKFINEYIKKNNLQEPADKRKIIPDEKLKSILNLQEGVSPSYFNLQALIKNHFIKEV